MKTPKLDEIDTIMGELVELCKKNKLKVELSARFKDGKHTSVWSWRF